MVSNLHRPSTQTDEVRLDELDLAVIAALSDSPRSGTTELATLLRVARNTVAARLRRLDQTRVLHGFVPRVDLAALGLPVDAVVHLQLAQGALAAVTTALERIPYVLEVSTTTGASDVTVRLACRSHPALQALIQEILAIRGVVRTTTEIALDTPVPYRIEPLLAVLIDQARRGARSAAGARRPDAADTAADADPPTPA